MSQQLVPGCPLHNPQTVSIFTNVRVRQTVCGISIDYYRQAGPRAGVSWCVRVRAEILHAIVTNQCLPPHVNHPNFRGPFMSSVRVACNMVHGDDFTSVIGPHFDRLVKHFAKRWVVANGVVLEDKSVADGFRFNQELVGRCFNDVGAIELWLRDEMGKLDWWEKVARGEFVAANPMKFGKRDGPPNLGVNEPSLTWSVLVFRPRSHRSSYSVPILSGGYAEPCHANGTDDADDSSHAEPAPCGRRHVHGHGKMEKAAANADAA